MKDTPNNVDTTEIDEAIAESMAIENEPAQPRPLTHAERASNKHRFFSVVFFLVSATMAGLIIFYPPMLQNALMPSVVITIVTAVLGYLNFGRYKSFKSEIQ